MAEIVSLAEAVERAIGDGDAVAMEGFTHLIPFAAGHEIIRQRKRDLTLARLTPDLIYDQLIFAGCARKMIFSWAGNPGVGPLHAFRRELEDVVDECSDAQLAQTKLAWWRTEVGKLVAGSPSHPVTKALLASTMPDRRS